MRIVFDARVHLNYYSGISRYIICLLEAYLELFSQDELIVLVNPTIKKDNAIYKALNKFDHVRIETIQTAHMGPKNYLVMGRIIKKFRPDVYHYPHLDAPIFIGKIPLVATIHDTNSNDKVKKFDDRFGLKSFYFRKSLSWTLKHAKRVIFVSDTIKKEVLELYGLKQDDQKYRRIYNGLESDFNQNNSEEAKRVFDEFKVHGKFILYVGQIREHKNIRRLVEAFKIFQIKNPEYSLVLIGHNYLGENFNESKIIQIEKVNESQLKSFYSRCEFFLFPSLFEGFGFPILEAFSFGKNVVTSNYGAMKEVSGELAILVDPKSVESIADGMSKACFQDQQTENRITHAAKFSWKENAKAVHAIYLEAINRPEIS